MSSTFNPACVEELHKEKFYKLMKSQKPPPQFPQSCNMDHKSPKAIYHAFSSAGGMAKAGPMPISLGSTPTWMRNVLALWPFAGGGITNYIPYKQCIKQCHHSDKPTRQTAQSMSVKTPQTRSDKRELEAAKRMWSKENRKGCSLQRSENYGTQQQDNSKEAKGLTQSQIRRKIWRIARGKDHRRSIVPNKVQTHLETKSRTQLIINSLKKENPMAQGSQRKQKSGSGPQWAGPTSLPWSASWNTNCSSAENLQADSVDWHHLAPCLARSTMAAPSVTWLLFPAVVLPPALKALRVSEQYLCDIQTYMRILKLTFDLTIQGHIQAKKRVSTCQGSPWWYQRVDPRLWLPPASWCFRPVTSF